MSTTETKQKTNKAKDRAKAKLLKTEILERVKNVIICDSLKYIETKRFDIKGLKPSTYIIYGAYNSKINKMQKVEFHIESKQICFVLHSI